jgi:hypothetical protein
MYNEHLAHAGVALSIEQLRERQNNARRDFQRVLEHIVDALAQENPVKPAASSSGTLAGAALARASRRVGNDTRERRELAHMLLVGALLNHDNPDWDPADAATDRANEDDPFIALLQMDLTAEK